MNIFLHELRAYRKSTIIWTCSLAALIILYLAIFPAFLKDVAEAKKLLEGFPEGVRKALGISLENFFTLLGFYSYIFLFITLCGAIQAMNLGTSIISKEVRDKTADFLLTKPVSRRRIMTAKLMAALASLVITNVIYLIIAGYAALLVKSEAFSMRIFLMISITLFFVQLIFMALGVLVSVVVPRIKSVLPVSLGTVFGFFILNMFDSLIGEKTLRYITPFKYYDTAYIIKNASYETSFIITEILFIVLSMTVSYWVYSKKDIDTP
jgi:ABC-2 type transport system permease protein